MMEKGNKIILVLGIIAIAIGVFVIWEASSFKKTAVLTEGRVIHVIGSSYKIQYFTANGTEKIHQGSGKSTDTMKEIVSRFGTRLIIQISYDSLNGKKVREHFL